MDMLTASINRTIQRPDAISIRSLFLTGFDNARASFEESLPTMHREVDLPRAGEAVRGLCQHASIEERMSLFPRRRRGDDRRKVQSNAEIIARVGDVVLQPSPYAMAPQRPARRMLSPVQILELQLPNLIA